MKVAAKPTSQSERAIGAAVAVVSSASFHSVSTRHGVFAVQRGCISTGPAPVPSGRWWRSDDGPEAGFAYQRSARTRVYRLRPRVRPRWASSG